MGWRSKIVWSQGMFLLPHHFQQEARWVERLVDARARCLSRFAWGFSELVLDEGALAQGRVAIVRARGVMPDGTPFAMPELDPLPAPLEIGADLRDELVVLALPLQREGADEVAWDEGGEPRARFHARTEPMRDNTDALAEPEELQTGSLALRLERAGRLGAAHAVLGVAQVMQRRSDAQVQLERNYIPPQVACDATEHLQSALGLLHEQVRRQAEALAGAMGQLGHGVAEVADFLMLMLLNRHEPVLREAAQAPHLHPRALFEFCLALAGELSSFDTARRPAAFPPYRHEDLRGSFAPLLLRLRELLSQVRERAAVPLELVDCGHNVRKALVSPPELLRQARLVLAVGAQVNAEQLRRRFPDHAKLAPADDRFMQRVNRNLAGIGLTPLPAVPRELPLHAGFQYFELEQGGELWQSLLSQGALALHVAGEETFPGLELELWAIRQ